MESNAALFGFLLSFPRRRSFELPLDESLDDSLELSPRDSLPDSDNPSLLDPRRSSAIEGR